jgi:arylsulfatase A-like enzyme
MAAALGLIIGWGEGAGLLLFQRLGWLNWNMARVPVAREILYISPLVDLVLFGTLGILLGLLVRAAASQRFREAAVFLLLFLGFLDWCGLSGRMRMYAVTVLSAGLATTALRSYHAHQQGFHRAARKTLPWLAGAVVVAFLAIQGGQRLAEYRATSSLPPAAPDSPNVLIIMMDTVRADHLSAYGYARATTPNLERMAGEGVLFDRAISTSCWTLPAHVSLLTGRFPYEHGAEQSYNGRYRTLAQELRGRGYRTAAFSANVYFFIRMLGFSPGFLHFEDVFGSVADMFARTFYGRKFSEVLLPRLGYKDTFGRKRAEEVDQAALHWLDESGHAPFLVVLNYFDAHDPYRPPQPFRSRFTKLADPGGLLNEFAGDTHLQNPEQIEGEIDAYDGAIAYMDDAIGKLLADLRKRGLDHNTLVVIAADHGEFLGEHGLYFHRTALFRQTIQVPLIFYWPGHVPAGTRVATPVSLASVASTVLELAGDSGQQTFPGPSLAALWKPGAPKGFPLPLSELARFSFVGMKDSPAFRGASKSLVYGPWHLLEHQAGGLFLFNWDHDPEEKNNLAGTPEGRPVVETLRRCLHENFDQIRQPDCGLRLPPAAD